MTDVAVPPLAYLLPRVDLRGEPLRWAVLAEIERHPDTLNSQVWLNECGTAACIAGHTAIMTGAVLVRDDWSMDHWHGAGRRGIWQIAAEALDLNEWDADWLFSEWNTLDDLRRILTELNGHTARNPIYTSDFRYADCAFDDDDRNDD